MQLLRGVEAVRGEHVQRQRFVGDDPDRSHPRGHRRRSDRVELPSAPPQDVGEGVRQSREGIQRRDAEQADRGARGGIQDRVEQGADPAAEPAGGVPVLHVVDSGGDEDEVRAGQHRRIHQGQGLAGGVPADRGDLPGDRHPVPLVKPSRQLPGDSVAVVPDGVAGGDAVAERDDLQGCRALAHLPAHPVRVVEPRDGAHHPHPL
ncbi:MAG: hypothetical protein L0H25_10450 [Micrococcales bacterium]|nr:hypothetical protein [Micrococcales bacterium]